MSKDQEIIHNEHYIVLDISVNRSGSGDQSFRIVGGGTVVSFDSIDAAYDTLIDYMVDNNKSIECLQLMKTKKVDIMQCNSMLLAAVIEWAEELRENIHGGKKYLQRPFLNFDTGASVKEVVGWIKDSTGYDLSHYFKNVLSTDSEE